MKRALLVIMVAALYVLHQDFWFWPVVNPLVFGFIPIGLSYHACYTIVTAFVMWLLVKHAWPSHLEEETDGGADFSLRSALNKSEPHGLKSAPPRPEGSRK